MVGAKSKKNNNRMCIRVNGCKEMTFESVKIIRSLNRKKTVQAKVHQNELWVYLPTGLSQAEEQKWVDTMATKLKKKQRRQTLNSTEQLQKRAQELNTKYFKGALRFDIKYVTNQHTCFGSCTYETQTIRISDRIAAMPHWVQDYVILHELTHLIHPNHSAQFWDMVNQYRYAERAKGYLIAQGLAEQEIE